MLAFGLPLVPMTLALWVMLVSDRLVIAKFSTTEQLGLYTIAVGAVSILALADAGVHAGLAPASAAGLRPRSGFGVGVLRARA